MKALIVSTMLVPTTALACQSPSLDITVQRVAARYDYLCGCNKGSVLATTPPIFRVGYMSGLGRDFPDDKILQEDIRIMRDVAKYNRCD